MPADEPLPCDRSVEDALVAAARALTSHLDVPSAAEAVLEALQDVFGATSSWVLLHDARERHLKTVAFRGPGADAFKHAVMPVDAGIMGLAFTSRQVVFVPDAHDDDRWFDVGRVHATPLTSAFAVPLVVRDRALGVVGLDAPHFTGEPPGPVDVARLEAFAAQAAIAIANAQLYEASERDRQRLTALLDERRGLRRRVARLQEVVRAAHSDTEIIGESASWTEVMRLADLVAAGDTTVLLLGETGTGKDLLARRIHERSPRAAGAFVPVNCAALPEGLVESALFGHERGAFTHAVARKAGKFEIADGGTLFLDEIGDLPGEAQAKLLRVLQDSTIERVGGTRPFAVDVRVIAATNRHLEDAIAARTFRSDLFFRLSVFPITLPSLRERASDIPVFARHLVRVFATKLNRPAREIADEALEMLTKYHWPGNVRELQNVIERAVILTSGKVVSPSGIWLPATAPPVPAAASSVTTLAEADRRAILAALDDSAWRISGAGGAAEKLGTRPTTLHAKMKKLGIRRPAARRSASG